VAINHTILVTNVAPILHRRGYSIYDLAALYAVANRENQQLAKKLEEKKVLQDNDAWLMTWCRAGVPRLAFDRGISVREMNRAIKKLVLVDLIEVRRRGSLASLRRVNTEALKLLLPETKEERKNLMDGLFDEWRAKSKMMKIRT